MSMYTYDSSWDGLLSAIFHAFKEYDAVICPTQESLFAVETVETNAEHVERLTRGMARLHPEMPVYVFRAFCAEHEGFETDLLHSLRLGFEQKGDPFWQRQYPYVRRVAEAERKAVGEAHRFLGLVRFVCAGGNLFVGDIEPDCNILPLIGEHFYDRFCDQRIVLRDLKRYTAFVSEPPNGWWITELPEGELPPLPDDKEFSDMWKAYFNNIANPERANKKLQQGFVPLKHRKHLTEFL